MRKAVVAEKLFFAASNAWEQGRLKQAFKLFLRAAKEGDVSAQLNLAHFYEMGFGVRKCRRKSLYWLRTAAALGYGVAARNLGVDFLAQQDKEKALHWFQRAVSLGDEQAKLDLGELLLDIDGNADDVVLLLNSTPDGSLSEDDEERRAALLKQLGDAPKRSSEL